MNEKMESVQAEMYLKLFFERIASDPRIGITHIAVYTAILNIWFKRGCTNPIALFSWEVMPVAKVLTRVTYRKAIRDLNAYGYLWYRASFNKHKGSKFEVRI